MATGRDLKAFSADEAVWAAHEVADHDPDEPRTADLVPKDVRAAHAAVAALQERLDALPKFVKRAMQGAAASAAQLSEDRLQGLAELIQNADDVRATEAYVAVDLERSRLLFAHNGTGLTLHDVLALAVPWLSLKVSDAEMLGRYGIGLSTLHSLSDVLEVHEGSFHLHLDSNALRQIDGDVSWPGDAALNGFTSFVVPFEAGGVTIADVSEWLGQWGEAGLVFVSHLNRVTLLNERAEADLSLAVSRGPVEVVPSRRGEVTRWSVRASDARVWDVYSRTIPAPKGKKRARKAQSGLTPVSVALPRFEGDAGHLHVGLPVREIGLPFRIHAQFDPVTSRRDINHTDWNLALIPPVADLWLDAVLDRFGVDASEAWAAVPLTGDLEGDERTTKKLREALDKHMMTSARLRLADELRLEGGQDDLLALSELSYEVPELESLLSGADVGQLAGTRGCLAQAARSRDARWRTVLSELDELGADVGRLITVRDALALLTEEGRPPSFVANLTACGVVDGLEGELERLRCVVLDTGEHVTPTELDALHALLPAEAGPLWAILEVGARVHDEYQAAVGWVRVATWLREGGVLLTETADADALRALAAGGRSGRQLPSVLTDDQAAALRAALETLPEEELLRLGPSIGRAVEFSATRYGADGKPVNCTARPADAYIIERDATSWYVAGGRTPGLVWLHRRYQEVLRAPTGREGLGAQRLFRALGAETAPRIAPHSQHFQRYQGRQWGVHRSATGSPVRRVEIMARHHATYTVGDYESPDLDAVLRDIAALRDSSKRRQRAAAVLATLSRAWDRLEPVASTMSASEDYGWVDRGRIEAWWVSSAATLPWLTSERGRREAPADLRIRTPSTEALYGDDPARYLAAGLARMGSAEVLSALGVAQDAGVHELIERLEAIRSETSDEPRRAADLAAPAYKALAGQVSVQGHRRSLGVLPQETALATFRRGAGLVATNVGWRSPSVVFSGDAVFGNMAAFVPAVSGADALWEFLRIAPPGPNDAKDVLRRLSKRPLRSAQDRMVMLNCLRILAGAGTSQLGHLRRIPLWVGDRWTGQRPIYSVANPLLADALRDRIPLWTPGGSLSQLEPLVGPLGLSRIDVAAVQIVGAGASTDEPELSAVFRRAVANLRADLALSDAGAEASLTVSWEQLSDCQVRLLADAHVRVALPTEGGSLRVGVGAWLDLDTGVLFVGDLEAPGRLSAGAYAVAAAFLWDTREIAHAWVVAWSEALAGHQAEKVATAASEAAELRRERERTQDARLLAVSRGARRRASQTPSTAPATSSPSTVGGDSAVARPRAVRQLVNPEILVLVDADGAIVSGHQPRGTPIDAPDPGPRAAPRRPDLTRSSQPHGRSESSSVRNYTDKEREDVGLDLVRRVLGADDEAVVDVRTQRGVGADAVDDLENFFELKVHGGPIPDVVQLQDSQVLRAYETDKFFLVLVGNVESGGRPPEVRIIIDPMEQLQRRAVGHVTLSGVQAAKALTYTFEDPAEGSTVSLPAEPGKESRAT